MSDQDSDQDTISVNFQRTSGGVILGLLLVAAGVALLLDRTGALPASWRISLWPVLLIGYGVARLTEPRRRGREGLFFVLGGAWWLAGTAGWLSLTRTWPLLIVAAGASLVLQAFTTSADDLPPGGRRFKRRHGIGGWLLPVIVLGAVLTSGLDRRALEGSMVSADGEFRAVSVMGRRTVTVPAAPLNGGDVIAIMGVNAIDLTQATIAPGSTLTLNVFGLMGTGVITVPENWVVDVQATPVMARVSDLRDTDDWSASRRRRTDGAAAQPAPPRLIVRGTVIMGRLVVRS